MTFEMRMATWNKVVVRISNTNGKLILWFVIEKIDLKKTPIKHVYNFTDKLGFENRLIFYFPNWTRDQKIELIREAIFGPSKLKTPEKESIVGGTCFLYD